MEKEKSLFNIFGHLNPINRQEKEVSLAEESGRDEDAVIQIENLNIYIRNNHILKNVNLTLHDKKITCIIGPSGCGKTTLLRSINRMIDTTEHLRVEGRVLVSGEDIYDHKAEITHIRKKIGLLSQRPTPLPMSIYDNITYGPKNSSLHDIYLYKLLHPDAAISEIATALGISTATVSKWWQSVISLINSQKDIDNSQ